MILGFSIFGLSSFWSIVILISGITLLLVIIAIIFAPDEETTQHSASNDEKTDIVPQKKDSFFLENKRLRDEITNIKTELENLRSQSERFENLYIQEKQKKLEFENQNLKNQLSPHFLNNTLNNIYSLLLYDTEKARESIIKLKRFLSYLLYETSDNKMVSLEQEMNYINDYIELNKIKLDDELSIDKHFAVVNPDSKHIAPLILSPFVENAFKHGDIRSKDAFIKIELIVHGNELFYTVQNKPKSDKNVKTGIGTKNLQQRLKLLYPKKHKYYTHCDDKIFTAKLILKFDE